MKTLVMLTVCIGLAATAAHAQASGIPLALSGVERPATVAPFVEPPRIDPPSEPKLEPYNGRVDITPRGVPQGSSTVEREQALVGSAYTVLTPLFYGEGNNYSFFRFPNAGLVTATYRATLVGAPTARNYGTVTITVAPYASPQYSISDLFQTLGISGPAAGDTSLSLYMQSPQSGAGVGFQHVVWNSTTGFFENASICTYRTNIDYTALNRVLLNIHTTKIPAYPSIIFIHNYASFAISYKVDYFKAGNGAYIGSLFFNLGANDTGTDSMQHTEQLLGFVPGANDFHVNALFTAQDTGGLYYGLAANAINNLQLNALTNMSVACAINP